MLYYKITEHNIKNITYILEVTEPINTNIKGYDIIPLSDKEIKIIDKIYTPNSIAKPMHINIHHLTKEFVRLLYE